jgi:hypothetical protein
VLIEALDVVQVALQRLSFTRHGQEVSEVVFGGFGGNSDRVLDGHGEGIGAVGSLSQEDPLEPHTSLRAVVDHETVVAGGEPRELHLLQDQEDAVDGAKTAQQVGFSMSIYLWFCVAVAGVGFDHFGYGATEVLEVGQVLLLLVDAFLFNLCEAQLSHQELLPLLLSVALCLRSHRQCLIFFKLIACGVEVINFALERGEAVVVGGVCLLSVEASHASDGSLGHEAVDGFAFVDLSAILTPLGGTDGQLRAELVYSGGVEEGLLVCGGMGDAEGLGVCVWRVWEGRFVPVGVGGVDDVVAEAGPLALLLELMHPAIPIFYDAIIIVPSQFHSPPF